MTKKVICTIKPDTLLRGYPEFWRKELDLHLVKIASGRDIIVRPEEITGVQLLESDVPGSHPHKLIINSSRGYVYTVIGFASDASWFNPLARKIFEESIQGGNDFIYYRDEAGKVCVNRRIVCAAMRIDGVVVLGARHGSPLMNDAIDRAFDHDEERIIAAMNLSREEGFIDQYDQFWDRKQALTIAICAGQLRKRTHDREQLWSEDVW